MLDKILSKSDRTGKSVLVCARNYPERSISQAPVNLQSRATYRFISSDVYYSQQ